MHLHNLYIRTSVIHQSSYCVFLSKHHFSPLSTSTSFASSGVSAAAKLPKVSSDTSAISDIFFWAVEEFPGVQEFPTLPVIIIHLDPINPKASPQDRMETWWKMEIFLGCDPLPVAATTRIITYRVTNSYKPVLYLIVFACICHCHWQGPHPRDFVDISSQICFMFWKVIWYMLSPRTEKDNISSVSELWTSMKLRSSSVIEIYVCETKQESLFCSHGVFIIWQQLASIHSLVHLPAISHGFWPTNSFYRWDMNRKIEKTQQFHPWISLALSLGIGGGSNLSWQSSSITWWITFWPKPLMQGTQRLCNLVVPLPPRLRWIIWIGSMEKFMIQWWNMMIW